MEVEEPLEATEGDITAKLQGVLVEELSPIQSTLQVFLILMKIFVCHNFSGLTAKVKVPTT